IVDSGRFYPIYITGLSGNGKTTSVEQVCAEKNREFFRVNINVETDEDDLLGGFRLIDGNTVFQYGPVAEAMRRGAVLLLDEVDLGTTKIMCLQSVLEGKGVYLKKINRWVHPAEGFQVFLTGNTKGQGNGDHDDKFVGTNVLNEAFLDRIPVMLDQDYPPATVEKKILGKVVKESCGSVDSDAKGFIDNLAKWAEIVRHTFAEGAIEDVITTRRLVQIVQGYCILGDRVESIKNCLTRFDASVQDSFLSLYDKIDADVNTSPTASASDSADSVSTATVPDDAVMALTVSFADRNSVKTHGAEWNPIEKRWFFQRSTWNNLSAETRATITTNYSPTWADLDTQTRKMTEIKAYVFHHFLDPATA
ncbi:MAG: AAA family ATPase, partial [Ilumatobacteraceae bacterium]